MRIHDLLTEQRLDEKPMGMLKSLGNKAMAALGSGQAQGKVETGTMANQLRKQFDVYLGQTGDEATPEVIVGFLQSKGLPTGAVEKMLGISRSATGDQAPAQATGDAQQTAKPQTTAQPAAKPTAEKPADNAPTANTTAQGTNTAQPPAEKPADTTPATAQPAATDTATTQPQAQDDKAAIAARVKANVGKSAAATKASGFGGEVEKPQPAAGAGAFGQMAQQLAKPAAEKPATTAQPAAKPAATGQANFSQGGYGATTTNAPTAAVPSVTGGVSSVTGKPAAANPQQNLKAKLQAKQGAGQAQSGFKNFVQGARAKGLNAGLEYDLDGLELLEYVEQMLGEKFVVDKGTLDKIFMTAAQDAAKSGFKPGEEIGFAGGWAAGKAQAGGFASNFNKAYKGTDAETGSGSAAQTKSAGLKDETGLIPKDVLGKINSLSHKERQQLLKELG
jgi:hypothetical protein